MRMYQIKRFFKQLLELFFKKDRSVQLAKGLIIVKFKTRERKINPLTGRFDCWKLNRKRELRIKFEDTYEALKFFEAFKLAERERINERYFLLYASGVGLIIRPDDIDWVIVCQEGNEPKTIG